MKKFLTFLCAVTLVLGLAVSASALQFTLDSYNVTLNDSDPGLVLYWNPILSMPTSANFDVGDSLTFDLFELGTNESYANLGDDIYWKNISVAFDFSSPDVEENGEGRTRGVWRSQNGIVHWNNPAEFYFGDTGLFTIDLGDASFGTPGSANIAATLTYVQADTAPVPEPSTIMLMGIGLLGLVGYSRKRKKS